MLQAKMPQPSINVSTTSTDTYLRVTTNATFVQIHLQRLKGIGAPLK